MHQWDFKSYPVANVCAEYLRSIFDQPLICISSVNPELMEKVVADGSDYA